MCMNSFLSQPDADGKILSLRSDAQQRTGQNLSRAKAAKGANKNLSCAGKSPNTETLY